MNQDPTASTTPDPYPVAVVIPTLNEAELLPGLLDDLDRLDLPLEVIVADGGSTDGTASLARARGARIVASAPGRGRQLNAGAAGTRAPWLCFLHADVRLGPQAREDLAATVADPTIDAAVWRLAIDAEGWWFRAVEVGARIRDRFGGLPYGDQGLLIRRRLFDELGGFPDFPVMEDVALIRAVHRVAALHHLHSPMLVSARRWHEEGPFRTYARNVALVTAYLSGVSPHRLARWYPSHTPDPRPLDTT
jgi:rSAM/selenodomain-associated transferase 2